MGGVLSSQLSLALSVKDKQKLTDEIKGKASDGHSKGDPSGGQSTPKPSEDKAKAKSPEDPAKVEPTEGKDKKTSEDHSKAKPTDAKTKKQKPSGDQTVKVDEDMTNEEAMKQLKTVVYDPRFPNQNQTRNCYQNYLDYHRCIKVKNDEGFCQYYQWAYKELCPHTDKWDAQREMGIFAGKI